MAEAVMPAPPAPGRAVQIREIEVTDLPGLEWEGQFRNLRRLFKHAFDEARAGRRILLGAFDGQRAIGQIFVQLASADTRFADGRSRAYLYSLRVRPDFQRQGIGTRLLAEAEARLKARGFRSAVIAAAKENSGARRLYERLGYRIFMDDPGEWSYSDHEGQVVTVEEACWVMEKSL